MVPHSSLRGLFVTTWAGLAYPVRWSRRSESRTVCRCCGREGGVFDSFPSDADSVREKFCFWRGSVSAERRMRALGSLVHITGCMNQPIAGRCKAYLARISLILRLLLSVFLTSPVVDLFFSIFHFHRPVWVARRIPCVL